jgi:hypothetical protein
MGAEIDGNSEEPAFATREHCLFPLLSQPQFPPPDSFRMSGSEIFNLNNDSACLKVARGRKR